MIDLHSHLLFETDDGARTIEESIEIIKSAEKNGIDIICLTPHYISPEYMINKNENARKLEKLKKELKKQKIKVQVV